MFGLHDDRLFVLFGHQNAGGEGRLEHVDDQVIGQDVQLLHLVTRHIDVTCNPITDKDTKRTETVSRAGGNGYFTSFAAIITDERLTNCSKLNTIIDFNVLD